MGLGLEVFLLKAHGDVRRHGETTRTLGRLALTFQRRYHPRPLLSKGLRVAECRHGQRIPCAVHEGKYAAI